MDTSSRIHFGLNILTIIIFVDYNEFHGRPKDTTAELVEEMLEGVFLEFLLDLLWCVQVLVYVDLNLCCEHRSVAKVDHHIALVRFKPIFYSKNLYFTRCL
jgi:hypothetical protein